MNAIRRPPSSAKHAAAMPIVMGAADADGRGGGDGFVLELALGAEEITSGVSVLSIDTPSATESELTSPSSCTLLASMALASASVPTAINAST